MSDTMALHSPPKLATLKERALRAGGWSFGGYAVSQAIRLGSNLVMTRLLVPEMFGVMAIATMVTVILHLLSDLGMNQNIVQSRRGDDPAFLDTAWVVQIIRGIVLWLVALLLSLALYLAAGLVPPKSVYASPVLPPVIAVSSLSFLIAAFNSTKLPLAARHFDLKRPNQILLVSQLTALAVMIVIGLLTRSIWALVAGGLVASLITTVLSHTWMSGHANRFRWEPEALRELISFGKWIFLSSAVAVLAMNGDRLLLGGLVEPHVLGLYAIAALMVAAIEGALSHLFGTVALPVLSEIARSDRSKLREVYYRLRVPADLLVLFVTGLLFASGQLVIDVLFDPRYSEAGGMLEVLALSLFVVRYGVAHQIYLAVGIPRFQTIINVVRFISLYTLVPALAYLGGVQAAIWGIALHALATVPFFYTYNARLGLNDMRRELLVLLAIPVGFLCGTALNLLGA